MNPNHPSVKQRQSAVKEYLLEGFPVAITAKHTGLSKKRVYDIANREGLPFNRPVASGSRTEKALIELAFAGFPHETIGQIYRMATPFVVAVLNRAKTRIEKDAHPLCSNEA
jgi:hypothetical protein